MDRSKLVQFGNLELLAKQVVEGFITGMHKSPLHGFSVEFAEHRIYNQGESIRHIDWKLFGRTDRLYTKKYEEETNLRCQMVIDCSPSMYFPADHIENKLTFAIYAVVSLVELLKRQRDAYGISLFHESLMLHTMAKSSPMHQRFVYAELEHFFKKYIPTEGSDTFIAKALNEVAQSIPKRGMVMVFTDLWSSGENEADFLSALSHLKHERHEVVLFHLYSRAVEQDFTLDNRPYILVDMETGEEMRMLPSEFKRQYIERYEKGISALKLKCGDLAVDFVPMAIEDGYNEVLTRYLLKRQSML
ncbi:MAG: DUF58 domain-containing protein [Flavobacteriales bacterium]